MAIVAPSILSADFANLQRELEDMKAVGITWVHVDIMDGHFVPNISIGIPVVKSLRKVTDLTLDVHLMITEPIRYAKTFCEAGADLVTVHLEADTPDPFHGRQGRHFRETRHPGGGSGALPDGSRPDPRHDR